MVTGFSAVTSCEQITPVEGLIGGSESSANSWPGVLDQIWLWLTALVQKNKC